MTGDLLTHFYGGRFALERLNLLSGVVADYAVTPARHLRFHLPV
jgi:hypothetical protein